MTERGAEQARLGVREPHVRVAEGAQPAWPLLDRVGGRGSGAQFRAHPLVERVLRALPDGTDERAVVGEVAVRRRGGDPDAAGGFPEYHRLRAAVPGEAHRRLGQRRA
jgi:hypothetical protein